MNAASHVIEKLGGTRKAAARLSLKPSTVQSWKVAGVIPARRQALVLSVALAHGITLTADEVIGTKPVAAPSKASGRKAKATQQPAAA